MNNQLIISIGREFGSGGHKIAEALAETFGLKLYDKNLLEQVAESKGSDLEAMLRYDESPKHIFGYRRVKGYSNSPRENIAQLQFDFLRERAEAGESFVVVGRCAETVLREYPALVSIFVLSDISFKIEHLTEVLNVAEDEALELIAKTDRVRKYYHNQFCKGKWGDSRNYDLCVNSALLGIDGTVAMLADFIRDVMADREETNT